MSFFGLSRPPAINLGLQGGGAHGAFTWGVLDALLEDGGLRIEGVSGSSAGAMNAILLAQGLMDGGIEGARVALHSFWTAVAAAMPGAFTQDSADGEQAGLAPLARLALHWTYYLSPQQLNPFDLNPLRDILQAQVDFERLRRDSPLKLFIAATQANTGRLRLFRNAELSSQAVLASACLPTVHRAIEIDGEPYWDGGYAANPAVFPLFFECRARDILLVLLTPLRHRATPTGAAEIRTRALDIAFSATFLREMRMFAHLREQLPARWLPSGGMERRLRRVLFHIIEGGEVLGAMGADSKLAATLPFFLQLKSLGRAQAAQWLQAHRADIGQRGTVDLGRLFY